MIIYFLCHNWIWIEKIHWEFFYSKLIQLILIDSWANWHVNSSNYFPRNSFVDTFSLFWVPIIVLKKGRKTTGSRRLVTVLIIPLQMADAEVYIRLEILSPFHFLFTLIISEKFGKLLSWERIRGFLLSVYVSSVTSVHKSYLNVEMKIWNVIRLERTQPNDWEIFNVLWKTEQRNRFRNNLLFLNVPFVTRAIVNGVDFCFD